MIMANQDDITLKLINEVNRRKAEIAKAERPTWKTNCSFAYVEGNPATTNLHVASNIRDLVCIASFLRDKEKSYANAAKELGVDAPKFSWCGSSVEDWLEDIKTRISKLEIASRRKKLEELESRLNSIISPDLRRQMELEAIQKELA